MRATGGHWSPISLMLSNPAGQESKLSLPMSRPISSMQSAIRNHPEESLNLILRRAPRCGLLRTPCVPCCIPTTLCAQRGVIWSMAASNYLRGGPSAAEMTHRYKTLLALLEYRNVDIASLQRDLIQVLTADKKDSPLATAVRASETDSSPDSCIERCEQLLVQTPERGQ